MYIFVVGMARSGTHSLCNVIREACYTDNYVVHEDTPLLTEEAYQYMQGLPWDKQVLQDKISKWKSKKEKIVCECNHRLGFFVDSINKEFNEQIKYIWLIRNPIETMISDIATYAHWPDILHKYPDFFKTKVLTMVPEEKKTFNQFRIRPPTWDWDIWRFYFWEWLATYKEMRKQLSTVPNHRRLVFYTNDISDKYMQILDFLGSNYFLATRSVSKWAKIKADSIYQQPRAQVIAYAQSIIWPNKREITATIIKEFSALPKTDADLVAADYFILKSLGILVL